MCEKKDLPVRLIPVKNIIDSLPVNPTPGDSYVVGCEPTGDGLQGYKNYIAVFGTEPCSPWCFYPPCIGDYIFVSYPGTDTIAGNVRIYQWTGSQWQFLTASLPIS